MVFRVVKRKPCLWIIGGCGALIFAGSFVCIFVAFPALIDWQVDINYDLWDKESVGYKNFVSWTKYRVTKQCVPKVILT